MASCESVFRVPIIWLQFLLISSSLAAASYSNFFDVNKASPSYDPQKVNLSLYYETLSLSCSKFIIKNLQSVFNNGLISIINLRLVPWGDAYVSASNRSILCKNGPHECLLNTIEACAINVYKNVFLTIEGRQAEWQTCFSTLGLPEKPVIDCYNNIRNGTALELQYGYETAHLVPPHTMLPWVLVNNRPIRNDYENFTAYVCNAYKGERDVPIACNSSLSFD